MIGVILVGVRQIFRTINAGQFTFWPCCNIGVTTMKMISSTSMISAIGITLAPPLFALLAVYMHGCLLFAFRRVMK